jgi:hypothetical protein
MLNPTQAQLWFQQADRAIVSNNIDALRTAIHQLMALLPQQQEVRGYAGAQFERDESRDEQRTQLHCLKDREIQFPSAIV